MSAADRPGVTMDEFVDVHWQTIDAAVSESEREHR
jgi:hypothetical protein